jgi:hypothetical protein
MPIGAGVALAIGLGSAAASAGTSIYAAHRAGSTNDKSVAAQQASEAGDRQLAREQLAANERARQDALKLDQQRWGDYISAHQPLWNQSGQIFGNLVNMATGQRGGAPMAAPSVGAPMPPQSAPAPTSLYGMASGTNGMAPRPSSPFPQVAAPSGSGNPFGSMMNLAQMAQLMSGMNRPRLDVGSMPLTGMA